METNLVIGTRGSNLALWQANYIKTLLKTEMPNSNIEIRIISTKGDQIQDRPMPSIGGKGLFTAEIEEELLNENVDIAVHSLKDLPTKLPDGLILAGCPKRGSVEDAFISLKWKSLQEMPDEVTIATGSLRRKALVKAIKPHAHFCDLRGNIETRLRKLKENGWDAIIMAHTALERLEKQHFITQKLEATTFIPAVGQGAIGLEIKKDRNNILEIIQKICCPNTMSQITAERTFMSYLEGGCSVPLGATAVLEKNNLVLHAFVSNPAGTKKLQKSLCGPKDSPQALGEELAKQFIAEGAKELLKMDNDE